jgi:hypothetical protein
MISLHKQSLAVGAEEDPGAGLVKVLLLLFYSLTAVERLKTQGNWTAYV